MFIDPFMFLDSKRQDLTPLWALWVGLYDPIGDVGTLSLDSKRQDLTPS